MIDFWEILGHAAIDNRFRKKLYTTFAGKMPIADPVNKDNLYACKFADDDYNAARELVITKMGPVSLMALGEWLVVSVLHPNSEASLDNVAAIVQRHLGEYQPDSPTFYQALGACIVDTSFRNEFNRGNEAACGFRLSPNDRKILAQIAQDQGFEAQAGRFHDIDWDCSCKDMCLQWGEQPYAHALENKFKDLKKAFEDLKKESV